MGDDAKVTELFYPRREGNPDRVRVSLMDTRAADSLVVEYDYERDGWSIKMEPTVDMTDEASMMLPVGPPVEVAFVDAWNAVGEGECLCGDPLPEVPDLEPSRTAYHDCGCGRRWGVVCLDHLRPGAGGEALVAAPLGEHRLRSDRWTLLPEDQWRDP